ncbi:MAG: tRNA (5-methylaminomethyl-2-thiouridine)(34)-methyltransferase MnmD [Nanobdellota archaeon]
MITKKVKTKDGSYTFYNEKADEHYHTLTGAFEEAEKKHLEPSKPYINNGSTIIDFCFGLGYNSFAALKYAHKKGYFIKIIALENDNEIIQKINDIDLGTYSQYWNKAEIKDNHKIQTPGGEIIFLIGDAKEKINEVENFRKADVVFFDPFSLRKTPEMWSEKVFKDVYRICSDNSIMTTYSCSRKVRKNMEIAGFKVEDGPVVGRKAPGTVAFKKVN